jgi:tRNA(adenine34) deaminase
MTDQPAEFDDDTAMGLALAEASLALGHGDVPIGAVVLVDGVVVASRHNEREASGDPTAHAEVLAIRDAAAAVGDRRLHGATLVVTLEPCTMCAGAAWAAQVGRIVFGAADLKAGATGSLYNVAVDQRLNHTSAVTAGVRADACADLLTDFFASRR